jgi:hypothetical protein
MENKDLILNDGNSKKRIKILKDKGEYIGRARFGKIIIKNDDGNKILVDNIPEQEIINKIKNSLIMDKESIYSVHRDLIRENVLNQFWPISKLKTIIKKNFTIEEQKKVNYNNPEIFHEPIKKRTRNRDDDNGLDEILNDLYKKMSIE